MRTPRHASAVSVRAGATPVRRGAAPHGAATGTRAGHPVPKTFRNKERPS